MKGFENIPMISLLFVPGFNQKFGIILQDSSDSGADSAKLVREHRRQNVTEQPQAQNTNKKHGCCNLEKFHISILDF